MILALKKRKVKLFILLFLAIILSYSLSSNLEKSHFQKIILGPIIGLVTETSARILVEFQNSTEVSLILTDDKNNDNNSAFYNNTQYVKSNTPTIFKFEGLKPGRKYLISFSPQLKTISENQASFSTLNGFIDFGKHNSFNLVFISCNAIQYEPLNRNNNLWYNLLDRVKKGRIDYIFHIGDQIYVDIETEISEELNPYAMASKLLKNKNCKTYSKYQNKIRQMIKDVYIKTFTFPPTAEVLSMVPNFMILDDHEIYDDFGFKKTDLDKKSFDYFFQQQARYMYYQYQRQLSEDVDLVNLNNNRDEFIPLILNKIGFYFLDIRGSRTWHLVPGQNRNESMIGPVQMKNFTETFSKEGSFDELDTSLVIGSVPLVISDTKIAQMAYKHFDNDYQEIWTFNHQKDLLKVLDKLRNWKNRKMNRNLLLVGGDYHYSWKTTIFYKNNFFVNQIVTSGIVQRPLNQKEKDEAYSILYGSNKIDNSEYSFIHHEINFNRNYAIVEISKFDNQENGSHYVTKINTEIINGQP
jgi:phosphodiesterase/alkaline phosphatase D-like protein